ncbi:MAG TPA: glycosyltransferase family 4 protein [Candidatus Xenobia bacterium]|jgi:glycosyltransferase involved in cell wall biosynthesis
MGELTGKRVAVVHDWLVVAGGAEKVLEEILHIVPQADVFSLVDFLPRTHRQVIHDKPVQTSFLQGLPRARQSYRSYLPLMPLAVEQWDFSGYDLVISSSYAVCKGVLTGPDTLHVSYVHSPMRYAWDLQAQYLRESGLEQGLKSWLARGLLHYMRLWDAGTGPRVDTYLCNSAFIARRIRKCYGREAQVIHPPVDVDWFTPGEAREGLYVTCSRMVPYKKIDLIVEAFTAMPDRQLVVLGDGPDMARIRRGAGPNVRFEGQVDRKALRGWLRRARAFVFAALEDFGIVVVEAQACGTPVIAFGAGGVLETVRDGTTGVLYRQQTVDSLRDAVLRFESMRWSEEHIRQHAQAFNVERFRTDFCQALESSLVHNRP